jgi:hypothetical protein
MAADFVDVDLTAGSQPVDRLPPMMVRRVQARRWMSWPFVRLLRYVAFAIQGCSDAVTSQ